MRAAAHSPVQVGSRQRLLRLRLRHAGSVEVCQRVYGGLAIHGLPREAASAAHSTQLASLPSHLCTAASLRKQLQRKCTLGGTAGAAACRLRARAGRVTDVARGARPANSTRLHQRHQRHVRGDAG